MNSKSRSLPIFFKRRILNDACLSKKEKKQNFKNLKQEKKAPTAQFYKTNKI